MNNKLIKKIEKIYKDFPEKWDKGHREKFLKLLFCFYEIKLRRKKWIMQKFMNIFTK